MPQLAIVIHGLTYNQKLGGTIAVVVLVLLVKLGLTATDTGNWRGLLYSGLQVLLVAAGTFYGLRQTLKQ